MAFPVRPQSLTLLHLLEVVAALVQTVLVVGMAEVAAAQTAIQLQQEQEQQIKALTAD
jgi:uncharacterized membrane protein